MSATTETIERSDKPANTNDNTLEDGEIQDDFENISSDEEIIMRERIAELEARDKELQKIDSLVDTSYDYGIDYGKENQNNASYIEISDEEDVLIFTSPLKKKRRVRKRKGGGPVKRLKSPTFRLLERTERHRQAVKKNKSGHVHVHVHKKHDHSRRKKNLARVSSKRRDLSSDSESEVELDRSKLLAACRLTDRQGRNALKDKLSLNRKDKEVEIVEATSAQYEEEDEEELQLRLIALKSKQEIRDIQPITIDTDSSPVKPNLNNNNNEIEERELRLEALKSAYVKKHQKRLKKRLLENAERPYSPSDIIDSVVPCDEIVPVDDSGDVLIVQKRPVMIEINDSENEGVDMEISPCYSPKSPSPQPIVVDMELADSKSPVHFEELAMETEEVPSKIDDAKANEVDDEEENALRTLLLAKMTSASNSPARKIPPKQLEVININGDNLEDKSQESQNDEELRDLVIASLQNPSKKLKKPLCEDNSNSIKIDAIHLKKAVQRLKEQSNGAKEIENNKIENRLSTVLETEITGLNSSNIPNVVSGVIKLKELAANLAAKSSQNENDKILPEQSTNIDVVLPPSSVVTSTSPTKKVRKRKRKISQTLAIKKLIIPVVPPQLKKAAQQIVRRATKIINKPNKLVNLKTVPPSQIPLKTVPKLIIQVGQSDSDSNSDYYHCSEDERVEKLATEKIVRELDNASPSRIMLDSPVYSPAPQHADKIIKPVTETPPQNQGIEFQKNLEMYLKAVRNKVDQVHSKIAAMEKEKEKEKVEATEKIVKISTKSSIATPLAVRHLPKSSQLEYKRLVTRMAQLEKQKQVRLKRLAQMSSNATKNKKLPSSSKAVTPQQPAAKKVVSSVDKSVLQVTIPNSIPNSKNHIKNDLIVTLNHDKRNVQDLSATSSTSLVAINNTVIDNHLHVPKAATQENKTCSQPSEPTQNFPLESSPDEFMQMKFEEVMEYLDRNLNNMNANQRGQLLINSEKRYHNHCQSFMTEMTTILQHVCVAQTDREKLFDLENKLDYIKEKLAILEPLVTEQKRKVNEHFLSLQGSHKDVIRSRKMCINLDQLCYKVGKNVQGDEYNIPPKAKDQIMSMLHLLTEETKKLKFMKKKSLTEFKAELFGVGEQTEKKDVIKKIEEDLNVQIVPEKNLVESKPDEEATQKDIEESLPSTSSGSSKMSKYTSPLESLADSGSTTNHDGIICPFQLMGRCEDRSCKYMHLDSPI